ncbi:MAG: hypothetical protein RBR63_00980 [Methanosarcina vacuolata]|nr:hypothetical protein [Methanosarcina vacuolata]
MESKIPKTGVKDMVKIRIANGSELHNTELKRIADDIANQAGLAMDKIALNYSAPNEFLLPPDGDSFESILKPAFYRLSNDKKQASYTQAKSRLNADLPLRTARLHELAEIDLRKAEPVEHLAKTLIRSESVRITPEDILKEQEAIFNTEIHTPQYAEGFIKSLENRFLSVNTLPELSTSVDSFAELPKENFPDIKTNKQRIDEKYNSMGGENGVLGKQLDYHDNMAHYEHGAIYANGMNVVEVHGNIWSKYSALGAEKSVLGYPITDENTTPDKIGRYNHFQGGSIYWTPKTGAHEVHGNIREKWKSLGWEKSVLGYPITDESTTPDKIGRYNHFQNGSIYWTPKTGAHEIHGTIRDLWKSLGWEKSNLCYPITDELNLPDGKGKYSRFQGGEIHWYPEIGAYQASPKAITTLTLRCVSLHCIDETNPEYLGSDEMRMAGCLFDISSAGEKSYKFGKIDLEDGWDDNEWNNWTSPPHLISVPINTDNVWPKGYLATCILIESDGGDYSEELNKLVDKLTPIVKEKLEQALESAGEAYLGGIGAVIGHVLGQMVGYIIEKIFSWFKGWWNDDPFPPVTVSLQIPGSDALFPGGLYDSPDVYGNVGGYGGQYEFYLDWRVS